MKSEQPTKEKVTRNELASLIGDKLTAGLGEAEINIQRDRVRIDALLAGTTEEVEPLSIGVSLSVSRGRELVVEVNIRKIGEDGRPMGHWQGGWGYRIESNIGEGGNQYDPGEIGLAMSIVSSLSLKISGQARVAALGVMGQVLTERLKQVFGRFASGQLSDGWAESVSSVREVYLAIEGLKIVKRK